MTLNDNSRANNPIQHTLNNANNLLRELRFHQAELKKFKHEYRMFEQQMENTWEHYADLYDLMPVGYFTLDENGRMLEVNQTGAAMLNTESADITGKHFVDRIAEIDRPRLISYLRQAFQLRAKTTIELKIQNSGGALCDVRLESTVVENIGKPRICLMVMTYPNGHNETDEASSLVEYLTGMIADGIMITDAKKIIRSVNSAFEKTTGYTAGEVIGQTPDLLKSGQHGNDFYHRMWDTLNKIGEWRGEVWNRRKNGEIHPEWLKISAIKDSRHEVVNYIGIFSDALTQKGILEQRHYLAYYDGLTGLPNRRLFLDRLNMSLLNAQRDNCILAVIFVSLDQSEEMNGIPECKTGSNLLTAVAASMKDCLRQHDTLARFKSNEFAILIPVISHPAEASNIALKLLACCNKALEIGDEKPNPSASIGISIFPKDGKDANELIGNASYETYRIQRPGYDNYLQHSRQTIQSTDQYVTR